MCTINLLVVAFVIHHRGLVFCDVANGSSPNCVVETRQGLELALQTNNRATPAYTTWNQLGSSGSRYYCPLPTFCHERSTAWSEFKASNWLLSIPSPGEWMYLIGRWGTEWRWFWTGSERCVRACMYMSVCVYVCLQCTVYYLLYILHLFLQLHNLRISW